MAKHGRRRKTALDTTAEGIGRTLGQLANRFDQWITQRDALAADLRQVVGAGQRMLSELGTSAHGLSFRGTRDGGGVGVGNGRKRRGKGGRHPGFKMSAAARAKISAAQKARWAKQKKQG